MIRQALDDMNPTKKAVKAIRRFPLDFVSVSVEPMTRPLDQFVHTPM